MSYALQDFINSLSEGRGVRFLRGCLWAVVLGAVISLFYVSQYKGFNRAEVMESCQLARNFSATGRFETLVIRPADAWALKQAGKPTGYLGAMPDLRHAPAYPWLLSRLMPAPPVAASAMVIRRDAVRTERFIVPLLGACLMAATAFLVFWMGVRLFDARVGSVAFMLYAVSAPVLQSTFSGTALPLCTFLTTASVACCLLFSPDAVNASKRLASWVGVIGVALLCAAAFLSSYSKAVILIPVLLMAGASSARYRWPLVGLLAIVAIAASVPWLLRNVEVSGRLLGTAPFAALYDTLLYPGHSVDRELSPLAHSSYLFPAIRMKFLSGIVAVFDDNARRLGGGLVAACFWVSLFYRFDEDRVNTLKWSTALGLILMGAVAAFDYRVAEHLNVFLPCVVVLGVAFLAEFMERLLFVDDVLHTVLLWSLVLLAACPTLVQVFGQTPTPRYPPYHPPTAEFVATAMAREECIATDIPWATAWYGNRRSLLLPSRVEDLGTLTARGLSIGGVYLTQQLSDQPYMSGLAAEYARDASWLSLLNREMPESLPFVHGLALPEGVRDQLFFTDRVRWDSLDDLPATEPEEEPGDDAPAAGAE